MWQALKLTCACNPSLGLSSKAIVSAVRFCLRLLVHLQALMMHLLLPKVYLISCSSRSLVVLDDSALILSFGKALTCAVRFELYWRDYWCCSLALVIALLKVCLGSCPPRSLVQLNYVEFCWSDSLCTLVPIWRSSSAVDCIDLWQWRYLFIWGLYLMFKELVPESREELAQSRFCCRRLLYGI